MTAAPGLADPNRHRSNRRVRPVPRGQAPPDTSRRRDHAAPACIAASTRRRYGRPHTRLTPTDLPLRRREPGGPPGGMLRAVYERGIAPDVLVGTSAGALNASFVASRPQTVATANQLARIWHGLRREDIFPVSMRTLVAGLCGRCQLVPDRGLHQLVARYVEFQDISDAAIALHVVAYDLNEGCEVRLSQGSAVDVIAAAWRRSRVSRRPCGSARAFSSIVGS